MSTETVQPSPGPDGQASAGERPSARLRWLGRWGRAVLGTGIRRELTLVCLGALVVAAVMTWPALRSPATTTPGDLSDSLLVTYLISWNGHALLTDPASLWNTNSFWPELNSLAFTESFLGYTPAALIGDGPAAALLRYNLIFWLTIALASIGAYALARQLGSRVPGALVAGLAFAYAPWRLAHFSHLHVLSTGAIALSLAMLARGYGYSFRTGYRPDRIRPGWIIGGWLVAAWQVTIGFGVSLPFAYVLLGLCLFFAARWLIRRPRPAVPRNLIATTLVGGLAFSATALLMAGPYLKVAEDFPYARRGLTELAGFSPPTRGLFAAPQESWLWGELTKPLREGMLAPGETAILPGITIIVLGLCGLLASSWTVRQRVAMGAALVVATILSLGTTVFGGALTHAPLLAVLPGWDALRTPGRLIIWVTLLLGLLTAGLLTELQEQFVRRGWTWPTRRDRALGLEAPHPVSPALRLMSLILVVPALLTGVEGVPINQPRTVPQAPAAMATAAEPILVLPSDPWGDSSPMFWSIGRYPKVANGIGAFIPMSTNQFRLASASFPDPNSVEFLRRSGIRTVLVLPSRTAGTPWQRAATAPVDGLPLVRRVEGASVVFTLDPPGVTR